MGWPIPLNTCHECASMGQMRPVSFFFLFFRICIWKASDWSGWKSSRAIILGEEAERKTGSQKRKSRSSFKTGSDEEGGCPIPPIPFVKYIHNRPYIYNHIILDSIPDQACPNRTKPGHIG